MQRAASVACVLVLLACSLQCGGSDASRSGSTEAAPATTLGGAAETCALLTQTEIAEAVGNPVTKGERFTGSADCSWNVDTRGDVTVLLIVHRTGSIREQVLCPDLLKGGKAQGFEGVGDGSTWKFGSVIGLFNSGEFESCGSKGFISLQLNGEQDEAKLKQATTALAGKILARL